MRINLIRVKTSYQLDPREALRIFLNFKNYQLGYILWKMIFIKIYAYFLGI